METHPAQAQLAGPAQVKVYKTNCLDKVSQPHEFIYLYKSPQEASFSTISAGDINLRRTFLMFRTFFSVTTAAATVTAVFARFFVSVAYAFIIIFRRGFWQLDASPSLLLFNQLKRTK
jgi:hypothetical protein